MKKFASLSRKYKRVYGQFYKKIGSRKRIWKWEILLQNIITIFKAKYLGVSEVGRGCIFFKIRTKELTLMLGITKNMYLTGVMVGNEKTADFFLLLHDRADEKSLKKVKQYATEKMCKAGRNSIGIED